MSESLFACLYQPPLPGAGMAGSEDPAPRTVVRGVGSVVRGVGSLDPTIPAVAASHTRNPLVAIAAEFSPRYEQHRADLVSVDVRGLSRLFGSPRAIGAEMRREAASRGVRVHTAIAPTRMAALVLAIARPGLTVVPPAGAADALASIPIGVLEQLHEDPQPGCGSATQVRLRADEAQAAIAAL